MIHGATLPEHISKISRLLQCCLQMSSLEEQKLLASQTAAELQAKVAHLELSQGRFAWQSQLLQRLMDVQLRHNKSKAEAIRRHLAADCHHDVEDLVHDVEASSDASSISSSSGISSDGDAGGDDERPPGSPTRLGEMPPALRSVKELSRAA